MVRENQELKNQLEKKEENGFNDSTEQLVAENEKLKTQLSDMIDKYKNLYKIIMELQEERKAFKIQIENQKR